MKRVWFTPVRWPEGWGGGGDFLLFLLLLSSNPTDSGTQWSSFLLKGSGHTHAALGERVGHGIQALAPGHTPWSLPTSQRGESSLLQRWPFLTPPAQAPLPAALFLQDLFLCYLFPLPLPRMCHPPDRVMKSPSLQPPNAWNTLLIPVTFFNTISITLVKRRHTLWFPKGRKRWGGEEVLDDA